MESSKWQNLHEAYWLMKSSTKKKIGRALLGMLMVIDFEARLKFTMTIFPHLLDLDHKTSALNKSFTRQVSCNKLWAAL